MVHNLKTHLAPFEAVWSGLKTAEFRFNDRDYKTGDHLILDEYDETTATYRGRVVYAVVTHAAYGPDWGIPEGYVMLSMRVHHVIGADGEPHRWLPPRPPEVERLLAAAKDFLAAWDHGGFYSGPMSDPLRAALAPFERTATGDSGKSIRDA